MVLGLSADALQLAFGIRNLPEGYMMQIPLRGPLNNVGINKAAATAKITTLMLWKSQAVKGILRGSGIGAIFGEVISRVCPLPDFNTPAPPAKKPFPWEVAESTKPKTKHKARHDFKDKPVKQLLKILR